MRDLVEKAGNLVDDLFGMYNVPNGFVVLLVIVGGVLTITGCLRSGLSNIERRLRPDL